jgi:branched-chain amino acid transport system substrate-binding protein
MDTSITQFGGILAVVTLVIGLGVGAFAGMMLAPGAGAGGLSGEIPIGYLADDDYTYLHLGGKVATEMAEEDINAYLEDIEAGFTISFKTESADGSATTALEKAQALNALGCKIIVGWGWTSFIQASYEYCQSNEILIVSHGSTAPSMSIEDDWVYRCRGSGLTAAKVTGKMLDDRNITHVACLQVGEAWGDSFYPEAKENFESYGIEEIEYVRFNVDATEFSTEIATIAEAVEDAIDEHGAEHVAVFHVSYYKHHPLLLEAAESYPELLDVEWFGSNGAAYGPNVLEDTPDLAVTTKSFCPNEAFSKTPKYDEFRDKYYAETGSEPPGISAVNLYDVCWLVAQTILEVDDYDSTKLREALPTVAHNFFGIVGWLEFDEYGDRAYQDYELLQIVMKNATHAEWKQVAYYTMSTGELVWDEEIPK